MEMPQVVVGKFLCLEETRVGWSFAEQKLGVGGICKKIFIM